MVDTWGYIQSTDANYTTALNGGTFSVVPSDFVVTQFFDGAIYTSSLGYLSFDTNGISAPDELFLTNFNLTVTSPQPSFTVKIAPYDWGTSLDTADWLTPTQLSVLTPIGSFTCTTATFDEVLLPLDLSGLTFGSTFRFVVYFEEQASATPPSGLGVERAARTYIPALLLHDFYIDPGSTGTYANEVAADVPDIWWKLEETSGTIAVDSSGNGNNGTFFNNPTLGVPGLVSGDSGGLAMEVSQAGQNDVVGNLDLSGDYNALGLSFEGIFLFTDLASDANNNYVVAMGIEGNTEVDLEIYSVDLISSQPLIVLFDAFTDNGGGTGQNQISAPIAGNVITHILVSFPVGGTMEQVSMYVNGDRWRELKPSGHDTYDLTLNNFSPNFLCGGGDSFSDSMDGTVDEISFYAHEISSTRAAIHYKSLGGASAPVAPTITSLSPPTGSTLGEEQVIIHGTGFNGTTSVTFDGISVSFIVNSNIRITTTSPVHAAGIVNVVVTNPQGSDSAPFTFVPPTAPLPQFIPSGGYALTSKPTRIISIRNFKS